MKDQELMQVLQKGEGQFVEFKEKVDNSLTNAVVHRDYFENGEVAVEKFENMIVVNNPGGLVASFPMYEFGKLSWPRNRLLADLLSKTIFMEKVGTGIKRMEKFCKEIGNTIEIKPLSTHFFVEMESPQKILPDSGLKDGIKDGKKDGLKDGVKLNKNQEEILRLVQENKNITQEALAGKIGISTRNVEKRITDLKEKGILKRIGSRKYGYWQINIESLKNIPDDGLKDGLMDGIKDGLKDGIKLSKNQEEILRLVQEDKNITREALAEKIGISTRNVEKRIADLKEKGILKRIGSRKSGCWEINTESLKNISDSDLKDGIKDGKKDGIKKR